MTYPEYRDHSLVNADTGELWNVDLQQQSLPTFFTRYRPPHSEGFKLRLNGILVQCQVEFHHPRQNWIQITIQPRLHESQIPTIRPLPTSDGLTIVDSRNEVTYLLVINDLDSSLNLASTLSSLSDGELVNLINHRTRDGSFYHVYYPTVGTPLFTLEGFVIYDRIPCLMGVMDAYIDLERLRFEDVAPYLEAFNLHLPYFFTMETEAETGVRLDSRPYPHPQEMEMQLVYEKYLYDYVSNQSEKNRISTITLRIPIIPLWDRFINLIIYEINRFNPYPISYVGRKPTPEFLSRYESVKALSVLHY